MTSVRQWKANKQNALRSSGPRTPGGKLLSSKNARRHGLSAKTGTTEAERLRMDRIVFRLTTGKNDMLVIDKAQHVAECHLQLERVKVVVAQMTRRLQSQCEDRDQVEALLKQLNKMDTYERKSRSRRKTAIRDFLKSTSIE